MSTDKSAVVAWAAKRCSRPPFPAGVSTLRPGPSSPNAALLHLFFIQFFCRSFSPDRCANGRRRRPCTRARLASIDRLAIATPANGVTPTTAARSIVSRRPLRCLSLGGKPAFLSSSVDPIHTVDSTHCQHHRQPAPHCSFHSAQFTLFFHVSKRRFMTPDSPKLALFFVSRNLYSDFFIS